MPDTVAPGAPAPEVKPPNLAIRAIGVLTAPRKTYAAIAASPRVLGALLLTIVLLATGTIVFLSSEVGLQAALDQQVRQREAFGQPLNDEQYAQLERFTPYFGYI